MMQRPSTPAHRPHLPAGLIAAAVLACCLLLSGIAFAFWREWQLFSAASPEVAWLLRFLVFAIPVSLLAGYGYTGLLIVWRRYGEREQIRADKVIGLANAQRELPSGVQSVSWSDNSRRDLPALPEPEDSEPVGAAPIPTFAAMLDQNLVGAGRKLILGYDEEGAMEGDWTDLYSTAIGGMPGQGKTTTQRFFACQTALHGARFACLDPHYGAGEDSLGTTLAPLGSIFLCPIADTEKAMLDTVRYIADIGEKRVRGLDRDGTPIILWVDELTALLGRSSIGDELAELLEKIAQEYRKKNVFVSASGQIWTASRATSELRDSFASVIAHRMKRGQARMLLPTDEAQLVERLSPGQAVLWRTSGATALIGIPDTREADVRRVASMIGGGANAPTAPLPAANSRLTFGFRPANHSSIPTTPVTPEVSQKLAATVAASSQAQSGQTVPAEAQRALALLLAGKEPSEIVLELRKVKTSQGATYQRALKEIMELIRQAILGGAK
jgi:hypothetical protein